MTEIDRTKLSELYPTAKSYDELRQEREAAAELRRPKYVSLKISSYVTASLASVLLALYFISSMANGGLSSAGMALAFVCGSVLVALLCIAVLGNLYTSFRQLLSATLGNPNPLIAATLAILSLGVLLLSFVTQTLSANIPMSIVVLMIIFFVQLATTHWILSNESRK